MREPIESSMYRIVSENNDYSKIATYIIEKYPRIYTVEEATKIAKFLVMESGFSKDEILVGKADNELLKHVRLKTMRTNSVIGRDEKRVETQLKTKKKTIDKNKIKKYIAILVGVAVIGSFAIKGADLVEDRQVSQNIGMLASEIGSDDYEHKINIVDQNKYAVSYDITNAERVMAYNNDEIAKDIMDVCTRDPELLDICLYNTYFNMDYNRLSNMDKVLRCLKFYMKEDPAFEPIYQTIINYDVFLDYLVSRGFLNPNSKDYDKMLSAVEKYKELSKVDENAFSSLTKEEQNLLQSITDNYQKNRDNLYGTYSSKLEDLVKSEATLNGEGR